MGEKITKFLCKIYEPKDGKVKLGRVMYHMFSTIAIYCVMLIAFFILGCIMQQAIVDFDIQSLMKYDTVFWALIMGTILMGTCVTIISAGTCVWDKICNITLATCKKDEVK